MAERGITSAQSVIAGEVDLPALGKALLLLLPLTVIYFITRSPTPLDAALFGISLFIPATRLRLTPRAIAGHAAAIVALFLALFFAGSSSWLFVGLTALAGFGAASLTRWDRSRRTLGVWAFIPGVYLACEVGEAGSDAVALSRALWLLALAPVLAIVVSAIEPLGRPSPADADKPAASDPSESWLAEATATGLAVLAATILVRELHLPQGQWVIWSAASVVVGDIWDAWSKLRQRAIGACIGAPLGLAIGLALPQSRVGYTLALLAAVLTLIALPHYTVAFGARCFFIALAAMLDGTGAGMAEERVENVLLGGLFGIAAVVLVDAGMRLRTLTRRSGSPEM